MGNSREKEMRTSSKKRAFKINASSDIIFLLLLLFCLIFVADVWKFNIGRRTENFVCGAWAL
jgi:hypothetical protein